MPVGVTETPLGATAVPVGTTAISVGWMFTPRGCNTSKKVLEDGHSAGWHALCPLAANILLKFLKGASYEYMCSVSSPPDCYAHSPAHQVITGNDMKGTPYRRSTQ